MKSPSHLAELFIGKDDGRSTVKVFTATPTPLEEKNLGVLFAVMEIDSQEEVNNEILDIIVEEIDNHYYQAESFEVESAFEHALQKANNRLQEIIGEIGEDWLGNFNFVIGVQKEKQLVFTNLGRMIALMIHNGKIIDVLDTAQKKAQEINPVKIFSNVVCGELTPESVIFFATESILDYLSKEKIKRIIAHQTPAEAGQELYNLLADDTTNTNFAALILTKEKKALTQNKTVTALHRPALPHENQDKAQIPNDSMHQLLGKESQTAELLTASIWPSVKKGVKQNLQKIFQKNKPLVSPTSALHPLEPAKTGATSAQPSSPTGQIVLLVLKKIGHALLLLLSLLKRGLTEIYRMIKRAFFKKSYSSASARGRYSNRINNFSLGARIGKALQWFKSLSLVQKIFFIVAIVLLLIFAQMVINKGDKKSTPQEEKSYNEQMTAVDTKTNEGKAAVLYDQTAARKLLIEARDLLNQIPKDSTAYQDRGEALQTTISNQLKQVNKVITLENPQSLLNYNSVNPNVAVSHLVLLGASMYAFDSNNTSVYRGNLEDKSTSITISKPGQGEKFQAVTKASPGTAVAKLNNNSFVVFNPVTENLTPLDLQYAEDKYNIADLKIFGTRLYTLDPKTNDIYKHTKTNDTFSAGVGWVNGDISLENTISMAIDGSIYVLKDNGNVLRLDAGIKDNDFALEEIDPALTHATKIYTDENTKNLYMLDPENKRVAVFTKEGKLTAQYTSENFGDLRDMVVDEANKHMYLLNNTELYEVELQEAQ